MSTTKSEVEMDELKSKTARQEKLPKWKRWCTAERESPGSETKPERACGMVDVMFTAIFIGDGMAVGITRVEKPCPRFPEIQVGGGDGRVMVAESRFPPSFSVPFWHKLKCATVKIGVKIIAAIGVATDAARPSVSWLGLAMVAVGC